MEFLSSDSFKLVKKQNSTSFALKKWNKEVFGFFQTRIDELRKLIDILECQQATEYDVKLEASLLGELNEWLTCNDILWKQKYREIWLRDGEHNTKFFHLSTIIKCQKNSIDAIYSNLGDWLIDKKAIIDHFRSKFISLFMEEESFFPPDLANLISPFISIEDNCAI
jgi:hypothetical protein